MQKTIVATFIGACAGLAAGAACASGFQLLEQNTAGLGNAYAGSAAVAEDASTVFFNPAGMTRLQAHEFSLGGNLISPSYKFRNGGSIDAPAGTGGNGGDAGSAALVPAGYLSWGLNQDVFLGLGVSVPFGLKTDYADDWAGRFQSTLFRIKTINVNPAMAWRVSDRLAVGAGLDWMHMNAKYQRYAAVLNSVTQGTKVTLDASDNAIGWNVGALFKATDTMDVGFSYRSQIKQQLGGELTSTTQPVLPDGPADAEIKLPDTFILSVKQKVNGQWDLLGDVSRTGWSSIQHVAIQRSGTTLQTLDPVFRDTWRVAAGANYALNDTWMLKGGLAYDQTPVKGSATRLSSLPDNNRVWLSAGTRYQVGQAGKVDVGVSYLLIGDADIDNNQLAAGRGRLTGSYKGSVLIAGIQYSLAL